MKHQVDPGVLSALWERVKNAIEGPIHMFVNVGIKPDKKKGLSKKQTEIEVWATVARTAFEEGVRVGYDMGMTVAGAPDPKPAKDGV